MVRRGVVLAGGLSGGSRWLGRAWRRSPWAQKAHQNTIGCQLAARISSTFCWIRALLCCRRSAADRASSLGLFCLASLIADFAPSRAAADFFCRHSQQRT